MKPNGTRGGMFSSISSGMLGGETLSQRDPAENVYPFLTTTKQQTTLGDEEEPDSSGRKMFPWQRMTWMDTMLRFLIMAVYYIGDEAGPEETDPTAKKGKGKWKSVSRAMMEKGFYVCPQQCEDKFRYLNKRYKRVNDILGKGTACRVVENPNLLDTMDLSPKMKEVIGTLLSSKHLLFREMCAYHKSASSSQAQTPQQRPPPPQPCIHSTVASLGRAGPAGLMRLEERQVKYYIQAFKLEKQRMKWATFSSCKLREMERAELEYERRRLEIERMVLLIRQKELQLTDPYHHHQSSN